MTLEYKRPVVVYGAGAIGGLIAGRLALSRTRVTAVARGEHLRALRADGLQLVTRAGSKSVALPTAAGAGEIDWKQDPVVVLAVKSQHTAAALDDLAAYAPVDTPILIAQNGVANEPMALRRFANVYGVAVIVSAAHLEPGIVVQQSHPEAGILDLGRYPLGADALASQIAKALREAGFISNVHDDIMAWKYRQLIANLPNGVTAAYRPGPDADELISRAQAEAEHILAAAGIAVVSDDEDIRRRSDFVRGRLRDDHFGSTWQSVSRGHTDVETDWFNGEIVLQARLLGLSAPVNQVLQRVTAEHARQGLPPRSLGASETPADLAEQGSLTRAR